MVGCVLTLFAESLVTSARRGTTTVLAGNTGVTASDVSGSELAVDSSGSAGASTAAAAGTATGGGATAISAGTAFTGNTAADGAAVAVFDEHLLSMADVTVGGECLPRVFCLIELPAATMPLRLRVPAITMYLNSFEFI